MSRPALLPDPGPGRIERPWAPVALLLSLILCYAAAGIGSAVTVPAIEGWYHTLAKPPGTPPDFVFAPVWTILYAAMALVLWQIWRTPTATAALAEARRRALLAFLAQLVLNVSWSLIFFGAKVPTAAIGVSLALLAAIVWTIRAGRPVIGPWVLLFVPYAAWVGFATYLTIGVAILNA